MHSNGLNRLKDALVRGDAIEAKEAAQQIVSTSGDPLLALQTCHGVMQEIGEKFARLEIFLSDLIMAGEAMTSVVEVLRPVLLQKRLATLVAGKIVIGTVQGDIHDIGKNIVAAMLIASGFEVHDLGVDVSPSRLVESAQEEKTDIIGMSALMTTSMPYQEEAIKLLQELGLREEYWVLVGGGPVTDKSAQDMGADGYAKDATEAATAAKKLMSGES